MRQFRLIFLLSVALMASGYRWRCYIFCEEQTGVQNDYVEERDECREYAQNSLDTEMAKLPTVQNTPKVRQAKLVSLFSNCMSRYGWDVPSGDKGKIEPPRMAMRQPEVPIYVSTVSKAAPPAPAPVKPLIVAKPETCKVPADNKNKKANNKKSTKKDPCKDAVPTGTGATTGKKIKPVEKAAPDPVTAPSTAPIPEPVAAPPAAALSNPVSTPTPVAPASNPVPQPARVATPVAPAPAQEPRSSGSATPQTPPVDATVTSPPTSVPAPTLPTVTSPKAAPVTPVTSESITAPAPAPLPSKVDNKKNDPAVDLLDSQLKPNFWGR